MSFRRVGGLTALALALASAAQAAQVSKVLGVSGWTASYDNTEISLTVLNPFAEEDDPRVVLEKVAQFDNGVNEFGFIDPFEITFSQEENDAAEFIIIDREIVFNDSGIDWGGFRFIIEDPMSGTGGGAKFDQANSATFSIEPFTAKHWTSNLTQEELFVDGGVVPNDEGDGDDDQWRPGFTSGALWIDANPLSDGADVDRRFAFKEQPIPIPIPSAAWTALSGLLGLGLVSAAKNWRRTHG